MQKYPDNYAPYLELPLVDYVKYNIEPAVCEIDHVGLTALLDLLCKPAGIAVQVLYLDRSHHTGDPTVIDSYSWEPMDQNGVPLVDPPTFRLLYRP
jgi:ubiquitin thioesterase protein OTUB1